MDLLNLRGQARFIAIMMVCILLVFAIAVPIVSAKKVPKWLYPLWVIWMTLEDTLSGIDRLLAIVTQYLEEMEDALSDTNDELKDLYSKRDVKEDELKDYQGKLDKLEFEHQAALDKRRDAQSRIRSLNREIAQIEATLSMLSGSESELRAVLEAQLRQKRADISQAEQDIKDANKIIHSHWRSIKRSWYKSMIGDSFSGITGELTILNSRIGNLESIADGFRKSIDDKNQAETDETARRVKVQAQVDKARSDYEKAEKNGNPNTQK